MASIASSRPDPLCLPQCDLPTPRGGGGRDGPPYVVTPGRSFPQPTRPELCEPQGEPLQRPYRRGIFPQLLDLSPPGSASSSPSSTHSSHPPALCGSPKSHTLPWQLGAPVQVPASLCHCSWCPYSRGSSDLPTPSCYF